METSDQPTGMRTSGPIGETLRWMRSLSHFEGVS